jgi:hypothetical protein
MLECNVEQELVWRQSGSIPISCLSENVATGGGRLPRHLLTIAAKLERNVGFTGDDLATVCDVDVAHRLTEALWRRACELRIDGRLTSQLPARMEDLGRALCVRELVQVIAGVVTTGFVFDPDAANVFEGAPLVRRLRYYIRRVQRSWRSTPQIAEQATRTGIDRGVCLDYATATRVLFYALKRATGAPEHAFVISIFGPALDLTSKYQHAWNLIVDGQAHLLASFDASSRRLRSTPPGQRFEYAIDLTQYRNVSGLLGTAYAASLVAEPPIDWNDVFEVLCASIEPNTDRGLVLLFHLAENVLIPSNVRRRIVAHLAARGFERLVRDWQSRLARRDDVIGLGFGRWLYSARGSHLFAIEALLS